MSSGLIFYIYIILNFQAIIICFIIFFISAYEKRTLNFEFFGKFSGISNCWKISGKIGLSVVHFWRKFDLLFFLFFFLYTVTLGFPDLFSWVVQCAGKDGSKVTTVVATPGAGPDRPQEVAYTDTKVIGNGSFGVVYQAKLCDSGEMVAIKKVLQDKRFKVSASLHYRDK